MQYIKVTTAEQLKELVGKGRHDYFISLAGGATRSSKHITEGEDKTFCVYNNIDDTEQELSAEDLFDKSQTNIGEAMEKGAFWCECDAVTVFVVLSDTVYDFEGGCSVVGVYSTKELAIKALRLEKEDQFPDYEDLCDVIDVDEQDRFEAYEDGYASRNHFYLSIHETDIDG